MKKKVKSLIVILIHLLILRPLLRIFFGVNIDGKYNLKKLKQFIIISNHNSHLDIILLFYFLPLKYILNTHPIAAKEYFEKSKIGFFLVDLLFSPIWITRKKINREYNPLNEIKKILSEGENIIIFPEGTRGSSGDIKHFKSGIGRIAVEHNEIPIIPVFLFGPERVMPKNTILPLPLWNNILVGPPQHPHGSHQEITRSLEKLVCELSESEKAYRHCRHIDKKDNIVTIAFLGIDGSGKSTISRNISLLLSENSRSVYISDSLECYENGKKKKIQPLIAEKTRNTINMYAKNAGSLKSYKIPKLIELLFRDYLLNETKRWYNPEYIIQDGSPLLNLTAWSIIYKEKAFKKKNILNAMQILSARYRAGNKNKTIFKIFPELLLMKKIRLNRLKLPDLIIFLDTNPAISIKRINKRGKRKQVHETKEKLEKLKDAYRVVCEVTENKLKIPVLTINGNNSIKKITSQAMKFIIDHNTRENSIQSSV